MGTTTLLVRKDRLSEARLAAAQDAPLAPGQVRVRVDAFALTANNVTYAAFGEAMHYWQFFPAPEEGWGIVPVWGFGTVVQSLHPGVAVGERLYGYWPMASSAILQPQRLTERGFRDGAPHRAELHGIYNAYLRTNRDPYYTPDSEEAQALLRPLFTTSWLIDDFLADNQFFGADTVLLSSASSKTAYGTAFQLQQRPGIRRIGLTSAANKAFCESLGCYDRVLAYEELDQLDAGTSCVYVDFAGNAAFRAAVHQRFANLRYSCAVGGTHVTQLGGAGHLPGPRPTLFFAPAQAKRRSQDWGAAELDQRLVDAWHAFRTHVADPARPWLRVERHPNADAALQTYQRLAAGDTQPASGHILSVR
ncbi:DUF2855 family protein [Ramlibacter sp. XY19]|uniref:DUF2855 family protein n=1 Tax=Ramlibacter paludis TaxID=2908000 RepID=UPI0023D9D7C8|nr:DUF2855 family protein [Ramlibacter paludis]MCG2594926.1 DUF2855 family protein [Ramlibacter paludis]